MNSGMATLLFIFGLLKLHGVRADIIDFSLRRYQYFRSPAVQIARKISERGVRGLGVGIQSGSLGFVGVAIICTLRKKHAMTAKLQTI